MDKKLIGDETKRDNQLRSDIRNHLKSLGSKALYTAIKTAMKPARSCVPPPTRHIPKPMMCWTG